MTQQTPAAKARAARRRRMRERQALIFGSLVTLLLVAGVLAGGVYLNLIPAPFDRTITRPSDDPKSLALIQPCPPPGTLPVGVDAVALTILNGAGINGLAGRTAADATARGFVVQATDNAPTAYDGDVEVIFGTNGVAAAYTFAAHLANPLLILDNREDATVTVVLGKVFAGLKPVEESVLDPAVPLTGVTGCIPIDEVPLPEPSVTPTPSDEAPPVEEVPAEEPPADAPPADAPPAEEAPPAEG